MAPEEQMTTRWPSWRRLIAVSTMVDRIDSRGSCEFSETMDDVPMACQTVHFFFMYCLEFEPTELDDNGEMLSRLGGSLHHE